MVLRQEFFETIDVHPSEVWRLGGDESVFLQGRCTISKRSFLEVCIQGSNRQPLKKPVEGFQDDLCLFFVEVGAYSPWNTLPDSLTTATHLKPWMLGKPRVKIFQGEIFHNNIPGVYPGWLAYFQGAFTRLVVSGKISSQEMLEVSGEEFAGSHWFGRQRQGLICGGKGSDFSGLPGGWVLLSWEIQLKICWVWKVGCYPPWSA